MAYITLENGFASQGIEKILKQDIVAWYNVSAGDTCQPWIIPVEADKTVHIYGTLGGDITMQGTNDPRVFTDVNNAVWFTLKDNLGEDIVYNSNSGTIISQAPVAIRPSAGTGVTNTNIVITASKG